jgi:hypothetical protein
MAATVADRSSLAPQRCSEPVVSVARPMLVTIETPGSLEGRPVRCFARAGIPSVTLVRKSGRTHAYLGKGSYDAGAPYSAGFAAVAAG